MASQSFEAADSSTEATVPPSGCCHDCCKSDGSDNDEKIIQQDTFDSSSLPMAVSPPFQQDVTSQDNGSKDVSTCDRSAVSTSKCGSPHQAQKNCCDTSVALPETLTMNGVVVSDEPRTQMPISTLNSSCGKGCCSNERADVDSQKSSISPGPQASTTVGSFEDSVEATTDFCCPPNSRNCCTEDCAIAHAEFECQQKEKVSSCSASVSTETFDAAIAKYTDMVRRALCLCRTATGGQIVRCCERRKSQTSVRTLPQKAAKTPKRRNTRQHTPEGITKLRSAEVNKKSTCCTTRDLDGPKNELTASCQTCSNSREDVEAASSVEDILLSVQGMTCTGCEAKMTKVLRAINGVSNVNVTFVNGTASLRARTDLVSGHDIISQAQKATGFKICQLRKELLQLDIHLPKDGMTDLGSKMPVGVTDVKQVQKDILRLTYDPHVVGARSLLQAMGSNASLASVPQDAEISGEKNEMRQMAAVTMLASILTIPVCILAWGHVNISKKVQGVVSFVLATLVQGIAVPEFYYKALTALFRTASVELDMLVVMSITAAYVYSVTAFGFMLVSKPLKTESFFETSSLLISLVLLGRLIANIARMRAIAAVSLRTLQEASVIRVDNSGEEVVMDSRLLQFGDVFRIRAHDRIPTDGVVLNGCSDVDESMLTGESVRVPKTAGSKIIAGTTNGNGPLTVRLERLPGQNTITDIATLVETAQASKPRVQDLADLIAGYFIPVVIFIALVVFVVWVPVSLKIRGRPTGEAIVEALTYTIAVLAVSCPCAIGLAVPMVLIITGGVAARRGVIIKSASAMERSWSITDVVFDKTGTLTTDNLSVSSVDVHDEDRERVLGIALALARTNEHPMSRSLVAYLSKQTLRQLQLDRVQIYPGKGIEARLGGVVVCAGSPEWLGLSDEEAIIEYDSVNASLLCVTADRRLLAVFAMTAQLRDGAADVIRRLRLRGLRVHMVSGDAREPVLAVAKILGITDASYRQSPADKDAYLRQLMAGASCRTLFCGDEVNDAVAIARAHVGVSISNASDITKSTADVLLLGDLDGIVRLLDLSRATFRRIAFNFVWSGIYNLVAMLLASGALVAFRLPPAFAGVGELVSVLPVVIAAATMRFVAS